MPKPETVSMNVTFTADLHARMKEACSGTKKSLQQFIRDACDKALLDWHTRLRLEQEETERVRQSKIESRLQIVSTMRGGLEVKMPPTKHVRGPLPNERLGSIYTEHAKQIIAAGEDRVLVKRIILVAIKAVQREAPLTYPSDDEIVAELEKTILKMREDGPAAITAERTYDDFVGRIIDVTKVKTRGDVDD